MNTVYWHFDEEFVVRIRRTQARVTPRATATAAVFSTKERSKQLKEALGFVYQTMIDMGRFGEWCQLNEVDTALKQLYPSFRYQDFGLIH